MIPVWVLLIMNVIGLFISIEGFRTLGGKLVWLVLIGVNGFALAGNLYKVALAGI